MNSEYEQGTAYNTKLINLDKDIGDYILFNSNTSMKINVFFVIKSDTTEERFNSKATASTKYGREIEELSIIDEIASFGPKGSMLINNSAGALNHIIHNHTIYQVVVIISQEGDSGQMKYEPYIFDITSIKPIAGKTGFNEKFMISLENEVEFIMKTHHWVSLLKFYNSQLSSATTYEAVWNIILDYVRKYINVTSNKTYYLEKNLFFANNGDDVNELIKATLKKIPGNATIHQAVSIISLDACSKVDPANDMESKFQIFTDGSITVPLFFRDEYSDLQNF